MIHLLSIILFSFLIINDLVKLKKINYFKLTEKFSIVIIIIYILSFLGELTSMYYSKNYSNFFIFEGIPQYIGFILLFALIYYLVHKDLSENKNLDNNNKNK